MSRVRAAGRRALLALSLLLPGLPAAALPPPDRIYALAGATARVPVPPGDSVWEVRDAAGRVLRPAGPADPDGAVRVPPGGWYRLHRGTEPVGGRFAAGHVVLVTGQSQAAGLFFATWPRVGAHPAAAADPPAPPVSAVLEACRDQAGCPWGQTRWAPAGEALGARILLAELARRLPGVPVALADAAWGGAGIDDLLDPARRAWPHLLRIAQAGAPASALLILAHGTTDAGRGTPPAAYVAGVGRLVGLLREAGGDPAMPALQAPLSPLRDAVSVLGSGRLADWLGVTPEGHRALDIGLARRRPIDPVVLARAAAIRAAQAEAAQRFGLLPGGDMSAIGTGADGIHWSADGVRRAAREAAAALARALPEPAP